MKKIQDLKENEVIHCETEEQAKEICKMMHELGMTLSTGESYIDIVLSYQVLKERIAYCPKQGFYGNIEHYIKHNYIIHKATDFLNKQNDMKGKFIKVLSEEHGKRVIEYFKSKGVDTKNFLGNSIDWCYYGINYKGDFDNFNYFPHLLMGDNPELIELPNEPLKKMTQEEIDIFKKILDDELSWNKLEFICDIKSLPNENVYPKVMRVSEQPLTFEYQGVKRVVFAEKKGKFIAWANATNFEEAKEELYASHWKYAKDIDDPIFQVKKMTKEEIEKELGYKIEIV